MRIIGSMSPSDPRVDAYLAALPADQRQLLEDVRAAVRDRKSTRLNSSHIL